MQNSLLGRGRLLTYRQIIGFRNLLGRPCSRQCLSDRKTHSRRKPAVVADADESFLVLELAPDDGHWRARAVRVVMLLALNGDVVPGQRSVGVGFHNGFLGCEPGSMAS